MTIAAVAISLMAFVLLRTVSAGWTEQVRQTPNDRVITRHRMGWARSIPVNYVEGIGELPGVKAVMGGIWGGLAHPRDPRLSFDSIALDAQPFVDIHKELDAPEAQKQAFVLARDGALASRELADELGWKPGQRMTFRTGSFSGDLQLTLAGIFQSKRHGFAKRAVYFHSEYFRERLPPATRDRVNIVVTQVNDPAQSAKVARSIDMRFEGTEDQTFSQEDQATIAQLVARFGAVLEALDLISLLILGVVMLILGNTVAMGVRERIKEYATLRALGFESRHIIAFVLGESATLGIVGGALCLAVSYPLIEKALGRYLEESANFPPIRVSVTACLTTLVLGALLGSLAAAIPAYRVARSNIIDSLRKVG
jgi:putative ABC transport system permease protein